MQVQLRILRYDPERDAKPHWEDYTVEAGPMDRVLDLLHPVKWEQDGIADLPALLRARRVRVGRDAHQRPQPAGLQDPCRPAGPQDLGRAAARASRWSRTSWSTWTTSSPSTAACMPFLIDEGAMPARERRQSPEDRARYDDTTKCILCAACTSSCPSFWAQPAYVGPAAIVNAHRFIFDSRDEGADERLEILADADGVWRCRTIFNCTEACPRGINITRAILEVSSAIVERGA